jgi:MFS family permease
MGIVGMAAGRVARRYGSKASLVAGCAVTTSSFVLFALRHARPLDLVITNTVNGIGMGLAFPALGYLIVKAVPAHQTGAASGMNTVMQDLGGALAGQIEASFIAASAVAGVATVEGFTQAALVAAAFVAVAAVASFAIPGRLAPAASELVRPSAEPAADGGEYVLEGVGASVANQAL